MDRSVLKRTGTSRSSGASAVDVKRVRASMVSSDGGTTEASPNNIRKDLSASEESNLVRLFMTYSSELVNGSDDDGSEVGSPLSGAGMPSGVANRTLDFTEFRALLVCLGLKIDDTVMAALTAELTLRIPGEISFDEFVSFMLQSHLLRELRQATDLAGKAHVEVFNSKRFQSDTVWRWSWDTIVLFITLYHMIVVPLEWVDDTVDRNDAVLLWTWESLMGVFLVADMVVYANTAKKDQNGKPIDDLKLVLIKYLKTTFFADFVGTIPIDLIIAWAYPDEYLGLTSWIFFRACRLLRIIRVIFTLYAGVSVNGFLKPAFVYLQYSISPVLKSLFYFVVLIHFLTVLWLAVVINTTPNGPAAAYDLTEKWGYVQALYLVIYTITTIGCGDMIVLGTAQRVYCVFLFIVGAVMNGFVISQMSGFLQKANIESERKDKMRETLAVLRHFDIPEDTQSEILSFQHHLLSHNLGSAHEELMGSLPETIQESLGLFARIKFIALVPMFANSPHDCQEALATRLTNLIFHPGEFVIIAGEVGQEMYFLGHGVADVIGSGGQHFATLRQGSFFGEIALLVDGAARTASIKALTYCDTFRLERNDFDRILQKFPQFRQSMEAEVAERVAKFKQTMKPPEVRKRKLQRKEPDTVLPISTSVEDFGVFHDESPTNGIRSTGSMTRGSQGLPGSPKGRGGSMLQRRRSYFSSSMMQAAQLPSPTIGAGPESPRGSVPALRKRTSWRQAQPVEERRLSRTGLSNSPGPLNLAAQHDIDLINHLVERVLALERLASVPPALPSVYRNAPMMAPTNVGKAKVEALQPIPSIVTMAASTEIFSDADVGGSSSAKEDVTSNRSRSQVNFAQGQ